MVDKEKYYQISQEQLRRQLSDEEALSAKINTLLVVCGVLIAFLGELASRGFYLAGLGLPFIIIAMALLLVAYRIIDWQQGPNVDRILFDLRERKDINEFYAQSVEEIAKLYEHNEKLTDKKTARINRAGFLLMLGVLTSIFGVSIYLFLQVYPMVAAWVSARV